jgi:hypothetical protein
MFKLAILGTICCLVFSLPAKADEQRWFEVEVIIFSQTPTTDIQEQFDQPVKPIRPGRSIDLVTPLYQPNIKPILDMLPLCSAPEKANLHPSHYYQFNRLCVFEPQTKPWLISNIMQSRFYDSRLPMPDNIPAVITGSGEHVNQAYLVAADALQLTDITNRLQRQPDKKLLLHTAWRQVPVTQRRAIASHWYAGNNLTDKFDYWGQLQQPEQPANQQLTNSPLIADHLETNNDSVLDTNQTDIISHIEQLLAQLNANPQLAPAASFANDSKDNQDNSNNNLQPSQLQLGRKVPDHTWQLDGLFKLHLDHYLFVNTEFNLRVPTADKLKTIYVKQSRRVISGEIHYLDHPYLGIILQIRRFDPELTGLETQAETDLLLNQN